MRISKFIVFDISRNFLISSSTRINLLNIGVKILLRLLAQLRRKRSLIIRASVVVSRSSILGLNFSPFPASSHAWLKKKFVNVIGFRKKNYPLEPSQCCVLVRHCMEKEKYENKLIMRRTMKKNVLRWQAFQHLHPCELRVKEPCEPS